MIVADERSPSVLPLVPVADVSIAPNDRQQRWIVVASMALVALLSLLLYQQALDFAYFNDDPTGHFAWMEGKSAADFFQSSADYGYYRPVVFAALRATELLSGGHAPTTDHALLLLLHAANVAMVWLLAYRLGRRQALFAWVVALTFLVFPFNYEAVTYVASLTHPLMLFWLLLTLHLYLWGRLSGRPVLLATAWVTLVLALLTHENGLIALPALAGVEWITFRPKTWRAWLAPLWPFAIPGLLYIPLWLVIPKSGEAVSLSLGAVRSNGVPFLQSLVFPLLPAFSPGPESVGSLALAAILFLVATAAMARMSGALDVWLFALGWVVLSALPAMLFLSPDYLYGSPRLSYLPSVGIALLWGMPLLWLWRVPLARGSGYAAQQLIRVAAVAALLLLIIVPPQSFIRCQLDFYRSASLIVEDMAATARETPPDDALTFVNLPFFYSSYADHPDGCPSPYPWTPVGAVVIPPYAQARDFVRFNGGPDRDVTAVALDAYNPGWRTVGEAASVDDMRLPSDTSRIWVFDLLEGGFTDLSARWQTAEATVPPLATFGDTLNLVDAAVETDEAGVDVVLRWQVAQPPAEQPAVFVHLYGPDGALVAQGDAPPGDGYVPIALWQTDDQITNAFRLDVDRASLPLGRYAVRVGVYDPRTGVRVPATSPDFTVTDDAVEIAGIDIES